MSDIGLRISNLGLAARPLGQNTLAAKQENGKQHENRMKTIFPFFGSPTSDFGPRISGNTRPRSRLPTLPERSGRSKPPFSGPSRPQMYANPRKYSIRTSDLGPPTSDLAPPPPAPLRAIFCGFHPPQPPKSRKFTENERKLTQIGLPDRRPRTSDLEFRTAGPPGVHPAPFPVHFRAFRGFRGCPAVFAPP